MRTIEDMPDLRGRVAVVTGANAGLGLEVARALARGGARVVMAARDQAKARAARDAIVAESPGAVVELHPLDLGSLGSVRDCATAIGAAHDRIDLLVNNAGVMAIPERTTADGFEMQLGVNHLGHFVLTRRLLPLLLAAPGARVVSVTSFSRFVGRVVRPADPHLRRRYGPWRAYGQAKLANLLFGVELQRRLDAAGASMTSLVAHPGLSHTNLQRRSVEEAGGWTQRFWEVTARRLGPPPAAAATSMLRAATDPAARGGELYGPRWLTFGAPTRRPVVRPTQRAGRILWAVSERETGERFDVAAIVAGR